MTTSVGSNDEGLELFPKIKTEHLHCRMQVFCSVLGSNTILI